MRRCTILADGISSHQGKKGTIRVYLGVMYSNRNVFRKVAFEIHHGERLERRFVIFTLATCVEDVGNPREGS